MQFTDEMYHLLDNSPDEFQHNTHGFLNVIYAEDRLRAAKWMEEEVGKLSPASYYFTIRTLDGDQLIGELGLDVVNWSGRDAFVGLGIGETNYWSKGYGTDAMNILLRFAFSEINLRRVTLTVFEYNPRAIRSYEKAGFQHEGRLRKVLNKECRRWDMLFMGILREEWLELTRSYVGQASSLTNF